MSQFRFDARSLGRSAKRLLQQRLEREAMGDEAYNKMISHNDERGFRLFGAFYILLFAAVVCGAVWLGY
jgi:hypothetical protein